MIRKKEIVEHLYEYRVACPYDELKRFRYLVSCDGSERVNINILKPHTEALVQVIADNFDCNLSTMNGLKQTHYLAMMMLQTGNEDCKEPYKSKRLTTAELKDENPPDINFVQYKGSKKPAMPQKEALRSVLPFPIIAKTVISSKIRSEFDFEFLKRIVMIPNEPEYLGFNPKEAQESAKILEKATRSMYLPLIDAKPSDLSTMMTAVIKAVELTYWTGQAHTLITCDHSSYTRFL